jgi:hypothetical protein
MFCFTFENHVYLSIAKNASTSFDHFFTDNGWKKQPLLTTEINGNTKIFGLIADPVARHTKGLVTYLTITNQTDLLDDPVYQSMLLSSTFDTHTYSITSMIPHLVDRVHWIPLDFEGEIDGKKYNSHQAINLYFLREGLGLTYTAAMRKDTTLNNRATDMDYFLRDKVDALKTQYHAQYSNLTSNILENDIKMYRAAIQWYTDHIGYVHNAGRQLDFW